MNVFQMKGYGKMEKKEKTTEEKKYILQGTLPEIESALHDEFELSEGEAAFYIYTEIESRRKKHDHTAPSTDEIHLWYMGDNDPNQAQILKTPFSITITDTKRNASKLLFSIITSYLLKGSVSIYEIGIDVILAIADTIKKISEENFCVYGIIAEKAFIEKEERFTEESIKPYSEEKGVPVIHRCDRRPDSWSCPHYRERGDICLVHVNLCLKSLERQGIIKPSSVNDKEWFVVR